jgi:transcription elongation factor GreA-like protein
MSDEKPDKDIDRLLVAIAELIKVERIQNAGIKENREQIVALIEVSHSHDGRLDRIEKQTEENGKHIAALAEQGKEQNERINALIRIVEGHLSNHP